MAGEIGINTNSDSVEVEEEVEAELEKGKNLASSQSSNGKEFLSNWHEANAFLMIDQLFAFLSTDASLLHQIMADASISICCI